MNNVSFCGGETAGSIGKRNINPSRMDRIKIQTPQTDTVNFRGRDDDDSSACSTLASIAVLGALIAGGLGYAHKSGLIATIRLKDSLRNKNRPLVYVRSTYLPIQKCSKILSRILSVINSPVSSSSASTADFTSIEIKSCSSLSCAARSACSTEARAFFRHSC